MAYVLDDDQLAEFIELANHAAEHRPPMVPKFDGVKGRARPGLKSFFKSHLEVLPLVVPGRHTVSDIRKSRVMTADLLSNLCLVALISNAPACGPLTAP